MTGFSENARAILERRYLLRDEDGRVVESPDELLARVAGAVAQAEARWDPAAVPVWRRTFLEALAALEFLPNSPTLMNAGAPCGQLSACFVIPLTPTDAGWAAAREAAARVQVTGGGTGYSASRLPEPLAALEELDRLTRVVTANGKRRGANMGVLDASHPRILEFVRAKRNGTRLRNFNVSVGATDAFLQAVTQGGGWALRDPRTRTVVRRLEARELFDEIAHAAWTTGDPGLLFLDAIARANPTPLQGAIEATNPCGEVPLLPWESCNLASINLARMVRGEGAAARVDRASVERVAETALRFLDDALEVNRWPSPEFERMGRRNRKVGVGVMGLAEMLIRLGIPYDSDEAVRLSGEVMSWIAEATLRASQELARERGVFEGYAGSVVERQGLATRNATRTSIAPAGTIAWIAGTSQGIEPLFGLAYRRRHVLGNATLEHVEPLFLEHVCACGREEELLPHVRRTGRLPADVPGIEGLRRLFATATEIPWTRHLDVQAAFQRHVDNAVSKTVNLPREATEADVGAVYLSAWRRGLKGITVYREGSGPVATLEMGTP